MAKPVDTLYLELRAKYDRLARDMDKALRGVEGKLNSAAQKLNHIGSSLTKKVTAPILAAGVGVAKLGGDFQAAMNRVNANSQATTSELEKLKQVALDIGRDLSMPGTAIDAANSMDILAKNGLKASQLIDKNLTRSMIMLSKATGGDYALSADIATDAAAQFGIELSEFGKVADQISGVTINSKLSIDDYALAIAQGGGVTAKAGVSFEDFNATLAATAFQFKSGSDAGTSLKTFIARLVPQGKAAQEAIDKLGFSFFDANGSMRSMAEIAQTLQDGMKGLSDETRTAALQTIFGSDAQRTAVGLASVGAEGINRLTESIRKVSAVENVTKRLAGFNGMLQRLRKVLTALAIQIAESGFLDMITEWGNKIINLATHLTQANPKMLKFGTLIAGLAAAAGPATIALGLLVKTMAVAVGALAAPIGILAAKVALVGAAVGALASFLQGQLQPVIDHLKQSFSEGGTGAELLKIVMENMREAGVRLKEAFIRIGDELYSLIAKIDQSLEPWGGLQSVIENTLLAVIAFVTEGLVFLINTLAGAIEGIANMIELVNIMTQSWSSAKTIVIEAAKGIYEGVKTWLVDKLGGAINAITDKIKGLGGSFAWLYDKVVGNSWIPDMVLGVIAWGKKMSKEFFDATGKDIEKLNEKFASLAGTGGGVNGTNSGRQDFVDGIFASAFQNSSDMIDDLVDGTKDWGDALKDTAANFLSDIAKMILKQQLFNSMQGIYNAASGSGILKSIGSFLGFADGGRPPVGKVSLVGERGPELLVPDTAGTIIPNHMLGGGGGKVVNVSIVNNYANGVTREELAAQAESTKADTVQAVLQAVQSGGSYRKGLQA